MYESLKMGRVKWIKYKSSNERSRKKGDVSEPKSKKRRIRNRARIIIYLGLSIDTNRRHIEHVKNNNERNVERNKRNRR